MIEIDGSLGEGGGQMLRTALSLSCLLRKPFLMRSIRKGRKKPGLMPQHLMCVRALAAISGARVSGDTLGSGELRFAPKKTSAGNYFFDIGTAGSTSLLLQALLPPLLFCGGRSVLRLSEGTHVPFSPQFQYIQQVFIPMLRKLGFDLHADIERYGFYPHGGGVVTADIRPAPSALQGLILRDRGAITDLRGMSGTGNLPLEIAERQKTAACRIISRLNLPCRIETLPVTTIGQGSFLFFRIETDNCLAGFSSLGARGKRAEKVGREAGDAAGDYLSTSACLEPHLADQILIYLAAIPEMSSISTSRLSGHLLTNLRVLEKFINISYAVSGEQGKPGSIAITGTGIVLST